MTSSGKGGNADRAMVERIGRMEGWHFWHAGRRDMVGRLLRKAAGGRKAEVLDLACGTGSLARWMSGFGHRVTGLDLVPPSSKNHGGPAGNPLFIRADALTLPFRSECFDIAVALEFLEHVDDGLALAEIRRALKPGGFLLVSVPAFGFLWSRRDEEAGHRRRYAKLVMDELLRRGGFETRYLNYYQFALFPAVAASRLLQGRGAAWRDREEKPHPAINRALATVNRFEAGLQASASWPWGSSLVAVAVRR